MKKNIPIIRDILPDLESDTGLTEPPKRVVQNPAIIYNSIGRPNKRRGIFDAPEYDLYEIGRIEDIDAYVRQAFKKKIGLFLKEGFDYVGRNKKVVRYIKTRFQQIAQASNISHQELVRRCVTQFVKKSNSFLIKVRDVGASGGSVRTDLSGKTLKPVAGYFPAPPETMEADVDISGKPTMWRQRLPNGIIKEFLPDDVIHFCFDKKEGLIFGTPILTPVVDDIRALRTIEENIELLIYKHLFPIFQYKVGTPEQPAGIAENGENEIDIVRREIQFMPTEGGLVTPERHEIKSIGAESKALRAESYLEHFKRRVFSGLGMSAVDFGEGDTSNKSTSDNMSRALVDDVKDFQDSFEAQFNHFVIQELLLESTFRDNVLDEENIVDLCFREIDIDKQIKVETHAADLFAKNATTWDELRQSIGRDPIEIPEDPENADITQFPDWWRTNWKLFKEPEVYMQASKGALYSPATIAAANHPSLSLTPGDVQGQQGQETQAEIKKIKAKPVPAKKKDNFLLPDYLTMEQVLVENNKFDINYIDKQVKLISQKMINTLKANMNVALMQGLGPITNDLLVKVSFIRREIEYRSQLLINRLSNDIINSIRRKIDINTADDKISIIHIIFDSFKYRTDFISKTETDRAKNLGLIMRFVNQQGNLKGKLTTNNETCAMCIGHSQNILTLSAVSLSDIPPHHHGCRCGLQVATPEGN